MRKLIPAVAIVMLAVASFGAGKPNEVVYKTSKVAPSGFTGWTFYWTMPAIDEGATLQYVVVQPDGKEYYRLTIRDTKPGQRIRSDFSKGFAGGDPKVFYGKHILFKFIVDKGSVTFPDNTDFSFEFQNTVNAVKQ